MYKRILLKISGEALAGDQKHGINPDMVNHIVDQIVELHKKGVQIGIVVGAGNFWRGRQGVDMERVTADHMGMLATVMNSLALQDAIEKRGVAVRVQTALSMPQVAEIFVLRKALRHFEKNRIVVFACGTGNPFFSTDTAAAIHAAEIGADVILMAKNIDGIYTADPKLDPTAKRYDEITYREILDKELKALDIPASAFCMENDIKCYAFGLDDPMNIYHVIMGKKMGTELHR